MTTAWSKLLRLVLSRHGPTDMRGDSIPDGKFLPDIVHTQSAALRDLVSRYKVKSF